MLNIDGAICLRSAWSTFIPDSCAKKEHGLIPFPSRQSKAELHFCGEASAVTL